MSNTLPLQTAAHAPRHSATRHALACTLAAAALLAGCQQLPQPLIYTTPALTAQPPQIAAGQGARLSWDAPLGNSLRMSGLTATPPATVLVHPAQTTTYTLSGPAPSGAAISASVTVEVQPGETPLARLRITDQPAGARIAAGFLGLVHEAVPASAGAPAEARVRQLLRNLQNYGAGPLSIRIDNAQAAAARRLFAGMPAGSVTLQPAGGVRDIQNCAAAAPASRERCTLGTGGEGALATAEQLLDAARQGLGGVHLQGVLHNASATPRYYGMLFFAQFAGAQGQWLTTELTTDLASSAPIKAWAVRDTRSQSVRIALINHAPDAQGTVAVQLPAGLRQAVVTRLATAEPLRLAGQTFDGSRDGRAVGSAYGEILEADSTGQLLLALDASSAALITLTPQ